MTRHDEGAAKVRRLRRGAMIALAAGCMGAGLSSAIAHAAPPETPTSEQSVETPEPTTAGEWYARGYELAKEREYEQAAQAFMRSYELKPTSEALFNAALALENGGDTLAAIDTYERFLGEPSIDPGLVSQATQAIEALTRTIATLRIRYAATRAPAKLSVRGEPVGLDEFPLRVLPGTIEVEVIDEDGVRATETYELLAGEALIVDLRGLLPPLQPQPVPPPIIVPEPRTATDPSLDPARLASRAKTLRTSTWIGLGLTGASAVATVTLGALLAVEREQFSDDSCYQFEGNSCGPEFEIGDPQGHYLRQNSYALATGIVGGVSASLALTTLIVGVLSIRDARKLQALDARDTDARIRVSPKPGGLTIQF